VKITMVVVGRVRGPLAEPIELYETRAARYWKLEAIEVDAGTPGARDDAEAVREAEAERILSRVPAGDRVLALTRNGKRMSSRALSRWLSDTALHAHDVSLVIGGAWGLGRAVLERANHTLSLSALTLPHELARLVLAEQLYRAGTIARGEPYHKGN
jgi:23S rRNA (pseudouridine1915-N3)-methyltransferase